MSLGHPDWNAYTNAPVSKREPVGVFTRLLKD